MYELVEALTGAYANTEMGKLLDESRGKETPPTMADRLSRTLLESWIKEEPAPVSVTTAEMRSGLARRLLWHVGVLLVRGGQWLQYHYLVETAHAEA